MSTQDVLTSVEGQIGRIRLNRPKAIHALNIPMCEAMLESLLAWKNDPAVTAVMIDHREGRGFCAGGDIRMLAESGANGGEEAAYFFHTEYRLNHLLFTYAKPTMAFMDGITMGGGVGISMPCRYRVATENTRFAMPETGIGLFPDVGGGWYLSRLPGRLGEYIALTGARLDGADCLALGLATHYLPAEALEEAKAGILAAPDDIDGVLRALFVGAPLAKIVTERPDIDRLFAADTLEGILAALKADGGEWAMKQLAILQSKSPQSCKISLRQLREGRTMRDFAAEMTQEYALGCKVATMADFAEGVRAIIVDKDNAPVWNPATPEAMTDAMVDAIFAPLPADKAWTPHPETQI